MSWLFVSIFGYFLNAIAALIDKFLLRRSIPHPAVYAFFVSILNLIAVIFLFFDPRVPSILIFVASFLAGGFFTLALLLFFYALKQGEVSRVAPFVGGLVPIFILVLAYVILNESLTIIQLLAFIFIVMGGYFIVGEASGAVSRPHKTFWIAATLAAFLFALSHTLSKFVYVNHSFLGGLAWRSLGSALVGFLFLLSPRVRYAIANVFKNSSQSNGGLFIAGQALGAFSFVVVNYAFSLGPVALVNAIAGTQYVFVFLGAVFLSWRFPYILREEMSRSIVWRKVISMALIIVGVFLLFLK